LVIANPISVASPLEVVLLSQASRFSEGRAGLKPGATTGHRHYNTRQHERVSRTNVEPAGDRWKPTPSGTTRSRKGYS